MGKRFIGVACAGSVLSLSATTLAGAGDFSYAYGASTHFTHIYSSDGGPVALTASTELGLAASSAGSTATVTTGGAATPIAAPDASYSAFALSLGGVALTGGGQIGLAQARFGNITQASGYFGAGGFTPTTTDNGNVATSADTNPPTIDLTGAADGTAQASVVLAGGGGANADADFTAGGTVTTPFDAGYTPMQPGSGPAPQEYYGDGGALMVDLVLDAPGDAIFSSVSGVPGAILAGRGSSSVATAALSNSGIVTFGDDAPGLFSHFITTGSASMTTALSGENSLILTTGERSAGIVGVLSAGDAAEGTVALSGPSARIETRGDASPAVLLDTRAGQDARSALTLSGAQSELLVLGDDGAGAVLLSSGDAASSALTLSGREAGIATEGAGTHGAILSADGTSASARATLSGAGSRINTALDGADGLFINARGLADAVSGLSLSGAGSGIETLGNDATGAFLTAFGPSSTLSTTLGTGASILTEGDNSAGLVMHAGGGAQTRIGLALSGASSRIMTAGDGAPAAMLLAAASADNAIDVRISGRDSGIVSTGANAPALLTASPAGVAGSHRIVIDGTNALIGATGAGSNAANLTGDGIALDVVGNGATVGSSGDGGSAVHLLGFDSRIGVGSQSAIVAAGAGSAAIRLAGETDGHRIRNEGAIASAAGIGIDAFAADIVNDGLIAGDTAIAYANAIRPGSRIANAGMIRANAGPSGTAIDFAGTGDDALHMEATGRVIGAINLGAGSDTLSAGRGTNLRFTFDSLPEAIRPEGRSIVATTGTQVTIVALDGLETSGAVFDLGADALDQSLDEADRARRSWRLSDADIAPFAQGSAGDPRGLSPRISLGGTVSRANLDNAIDADVTLAGGTLGATVFDDGTRWLDIAGLLARSNLDGINRESDADLAMIGARLGFAHGWGDIIVDARAGYGDFETARVIANNTLPSGEETGRADYTNEELALGVTLRRSYFLSPDSSLTPDVFARLVHRGGVDYAERGATGGLSYSQGSAIFLDTGLGATFDHVTAHDGGGMTTLSLSAGIGHRAAIGGDDIELVIDGQSFEASAESFREGVNASFGGGATHRFDNGFEISGKADLLVHGDGNAAGFSIGLSKRF